MADASGASPAASCLAKLTGYIKTRKGFILATEIVSVFIILICYASSQTGGYTAVAICEMVFAIIFFVIFMMEMDKQIQVVNWVWSDLFRAGVGAVVYLITSLLCVIGGSGDGARIAGGVFGLLAGILFAYDAYTIYLQVRGTSQHTAASTDLSNSPRSLGRFEPGEVYMSNYSLIKSNDPVDRDQGHGTQDQEPGSARCVRASLRDND
ncbi:unnamed protein product [Merluccius merluccius]